MSDATAILARCHCGKVTLRVAGQPGYINECNCSLCNSHGVWWAYFAPEDVTVTGATLTYERQDKGDPAVKLHFCGHCGCTTHFAINEAFRVRVETGAEIVGVNMRLAERDALAGVELRFPDGQRWDGVGQFGHVREAVVL